jgi:hypothetical protein
LKKQSQFDSEQIVVSSYLKGIYGNMSAFERRKNKAKQSQCPTRQRFWCGRIEIAAVAALLRNDISGQFEKTKPIRQEGIAGQVLK